MALFSAIRTNSLGLAVVAIITAGAIALTQNATQARIAENREAAQARALYEIVPESEVENDLLHDTQHIASAPSIGYPQGVDVHLARRDGRVRTVLIPTIAADGYTGPIKLVTGIHADGSVAGVRVLEHHETPGLGDKVELKKSDWVLGFTGERLAGPNDPTWAVKKDGGRFDQFTGATITPRAVTEAVEKAILLFGEHRAALLQEQDSAGPTILIKEPDHG
ncbi:electron transport complex subunit RsxG [Motiliproteus sp. SC1-56]|uniref:electron transport complex subunit RsxG n=1 Tax=Motiliproteus sp. SC1-56 TaxID=2799565 RepID=UPI001A8E288C|nr:electron transport complex subunit RsxG [Motiliproteus sp. SC1-56]